jgi:DNA-binding LacI/PurR family transcriptional regulator
MKGLRLAGIKVPEDVSVIGLDNIALTKIVSSFISFVVAIPIDRLREMIGFLALSSFTSIEPLRQHH